MNWCTLTNSQMSYLNITVFWWCGNFWDKRKLTNLIQQILNVDFVQPINLLGLYLSHNWFIRSSKLVSAIFLYQQMIALKKLRKMIFISSKSFFLFSRYSNFCISLIPSFSPCQPCLRQKLNPKVMVLSISWIRI